MNNIITEEQKKEILRLAEEHSDALIAFGGDMYQNGMVRGAILACAGFLAGAVIIEVASSIMKKK